MEELVLFIVKHLVSCPEQVSVKTEAEDDLNSIIYIKANENDLGKIIGKGGKVVNSIRTIVKTIGNKTSKRYRIKIGE
ncbi:MAG: KH domain-containing protein [Clostridia bacterium]|nr:KH domain-containing protein [Clostridia bacterium]